MVVPLRAVTNLRTSLECSGFTHLGLGSHLMGHKLELRRVIVTDVIQYLGGGSDILV